MVADAATVRRVAMARACVVDRAVPVASAARMVLAAAVAPMHLVVRTAGRKAGPIAGLRVDRTGAGLTVLVKAAAMSAVREAVRVAAKAAAQVARADRAAAPADRAHRVVRAAIARTMTAASGSRKRST